ncbi:MAG: hypothetical protein WDW38_006679 [Sanguina aurantia]
MVAIKLPNSRAVAGILHSLACFDFHNVDVLTNATGLLLCQSEQIPIPELVRTVWAFSAAGLPAARLQSDLAARLLRQQHTLTQPTSPHATPSHTPPPASPQSKALLAHGYGLQPAELLLLQQAAVMTAAAQLYQPPPAAVAAVAVPAAVQSGTTHLTPRQRSLARKQRTATAAAAADSGSSPSSSAQDPEPNEPSSTSPPGQDSQLQQAAGAASTPAVQYSDPDPNLFCTMTRFASPPTLDSLGWDVPGGQLLSFPKVDAAAGYPFSVLQNSNGGPQLSLPLSVDPAPRLPVAGWLTRAAAERLFTAAGQNFDQLEKAAAKPGFTPVPLNATASVSLKNEIGHIQSRNVLAMVKGSSKPDEAVVYTAHWDHLGTDPKRQGHQVFGGAIDNGTGLTMLLEIANAFAHQKTAPQRSVLFFMPTLMLQDIESQIVL